MQENNQNEIVLNEKSIEILITKLVPTSQYFERSFEMLQEQLKDQKEDIKEFKKDVDKRFEQVDKRFEQVDKRFEQVDKRFEQVDKKIEKLTESVQNLTLEVKELGKKQEVTLREYIIERDRAYDKKLEKLTNYYINRDRDYDRKFENHRRYFLAVIGLIITIFLKMAGIIDLPNFNKTEPTVQNKEIQK